MHPLTGCMLATLAVCIGQYLTQGKHQLFGVCIALIGTTLLLGCASSLLHWQTLLTVIEPGNQTFNSVETRAEAAAHATGAAFNTLIYAVVGAVPLLLLATLTRCRKTVTSLEESEVML